MRQILWELFPFLKISFGNVGEIIFGSLVCDRHCAVMFKLAISVKKQLKNWQKTECNVPRRQKTNQAQRISQMWEESPSICVEHCTFWQLTTIGNNANTIDCPKKNFTKLQERRKFPSFCHRTGRIRTPERMQVTRSQNNNCSLVSPPKNRAHNLFDLNQDRE